MHEDEHVKEVLGKVGHFARGDVPLIVQAEHQEKPAHEQAEQEAVEKAHEQITRAAGDAYKIIEEEGAEDSQPALMLKYGQDQQPNRAQDDDNEPKRSFLKVR